MFDEIDRVAVQTDSSGSISEYQYIGPEFRELKRIHGNDLELSFLDNSETAGVGYDAIKRMQSYQLLSSNDGSQVLGREYSYNRVNHRTSEKRLDDFEATDIYAYDSAYRLISSNYDQNAQSESSARFTQSSAFVYDGAGNRRQSTDDGGTRDYSVNSMNEYSEINGTNVSYSDNGNLRSTQDRTLSYDYKNRLISIARTSDGQVLAEYSYDSNNRRREKVIYDPNQAGVVESATQFFYDGWQVCEEQDAVDQTQTTYVYAPRYIDDLVQFERSSNHSLGEGEFYSHTNARGDVVAVTDDSGNPVVRYVYDDFGRSYNETKANVNIGQVGDAYGFMGRRFDEESGFYYFRNRYYDLESGRFLQRDQEFDPNNSANQYTYAGNSPVSLSDPDGLNSGSQNRGTSGSSRTRARATPAPSANVPPDLGVPDGFQMVRGTLQRIGGSTYDTLRRTGSLERARDAQKWVEANRAAKFAENLGMNFPRGMDMGSTNKAFQEADRVMRGVDSASDYTRHTAQTMPPLKHDPATSARGLTRSSAARALGHAGTGMQVAEVAANAVDYYRKDERVKGMASNERDRILNEYDRLVREALALNNQCLKEKLLRDLKENMEYQLNNVTDSQITEHLINGAVFLRDSLASFLPTPSDWFKSEGE